MAGGAGTPGEIQNRGRKIYVLHHVLVHAAARLQARIAHDQRHAQRRLVHKALVVPAVLAHEVAVVGGVDDERIVGQPALVQIVEHAAQVFIHAGRRAIVVLHESLVDPPLALGRR